MSRLAVSLYPDEGLFGIYIRRGYRIVNWKKLTYDERSKIISHMEKVLTVSKANLFDKK